MGKKNAKAWNEGEAQSLLIGLALKS